MCVFYLRSISGRRFAPPIFRFGIRLWSRRVQLSRRIFRGFFFVRARMRREPSCRFRVELMGVRAWQGNEFCSWRSVGTIGEKVVDHLSHYHT